TPPRSAAPRGPFRRRAAGSRPAASAAEVLPLLARAFLDVGGGGREVLVELVEGEARLFLLTEIAERHAELQQIVGAFTALRILLVAFGKGAGGMGVVLADVEGLAEPVLRIAGERVGRVALDEAAQRLLRRRVVGLTQQPEGVVVLLLRRAGRQRPAGRRRPRRGRRGLAAWRGQHAAAARRYRRV